MFSKEKKGKEKMIFKHQQVLIYNKVEDFLNNEFVNQGGHRVGYGEVKLPKVGIT